MTLRGKEKIWYLVDRLAEEREITPEGSLIGLHPTQDLNKHYSLSDFVNLMTKLETEENVARLTSLPADQTYMKYQIELLPDFDKYIEKLESDPEYLKFSGKSPKPKGYFNSENKVDLSKPKLENQGKYLTGGQVQDILAMPEEERIKLLKKNLTADHAKDLGEYKATATKLLENFRESYGLSQQNSRTLSDVSFALPTNYEAQQVGLLKEILATQREDNRSDSTLITPSYYRDKKILVFCNRMIDLTKGKDHALLCNVMFNGEKPRKSPVGLGDLLEKWLEPDHKNTKRVRNAVTNLNNYIAKFTTISDLFCVKNNEVYFNPLYV